MLVFVSVRGRSLVAASGGHSSSRCTGLSRSRPLLLRSTGSRRAGSAVVAHGPSCYAACGIFPDQGSNPCPLHWQADSQPLRHQGSPHTAPSDLTVSSSLPCWYLCTPLHSWAVEKQRNPLYRSPAISVLDPSRIQGLFLFCCRSVSMVLFPGLAQILPSLVRLSQLNRIASFNY